MMICVKEILMEMKWDQLSRKRIEVPTAQGFPTLVTGYFPFNGSNRSSGFCGSPVKI